jgi:hypothetical protein
MGARLSKAVEYASTREAHEYQLALGLITIPLHLISQSGTKQEYVKSEHVTVPTKLTRAVMVSSCAYCPCYVLALSQTFEKTLQFTIPHVWMAWTMKTNRIHQGMASCYIGYLTYLVATTGNQVRAVWSPSGVVASFDY